MERMVKLSYPWKMMLKIYISMPVDGKLNESPGSGAVRKCEVIVKMPFASRALISSS